MADKPQAEKAKAEKKEQPQAAAAAPEAPAAQASQQVQLDDSAVSSCYANFCRVTGTPEELIIDFGLNTQPVGIPEKPIRINDRIILNHYTAKRLLAALSMSVQRHEAAFGVLETDVRKRVQAPAQGGAAPAKA
ncbi:MAG: DUF3467 domain-containing protein [Planctomycetaceae bacterium]|nr:DUF3467 domain-containing protein [Planctomycetaceae bacterium]